VPEETPAAVRDLILECLEARPSRRPAALELVQRLAALPDSEAPAAGRAGLSPGRSPGSSRRASNESPQSPDAAAAAALRRSGSLPPTGLPPTGLRRSGSRTLSSGSTSGGRGMASGGSGVTPPRRSTPGSGDQITTPRRSTAGSGDQITPPRSGIGSDSGGVAAALRALLGRTQSESLGLGEAVAQRLQRTLPGVRSSVRSGPQLGGAAGQRAPGAAREQGGASSVRASI
jgi:hypothetical protein